MQVRAEEPENCRAAGASGQEVLMDIQELRYFLAAYDGRSYARAASLLFLSRQALRQKLLHLEEELGSPLFTSEGKVLVPTKAGEMLNRECRPIVFQFDQMEQKMLASSPKMSGELKIAFGIGAVTFVNPDLLLTFEENYPRVKLSVMENSDTVVMTDVLSGKTALGIVGAARDLLGDADAVQIQHSGLYLRVHQDNPLSVRQELYPEDLDGQKFISFGEQNHAHQILYRECVMRGVMPHFVFCTQDTRSAKQIARNYKGITWSCPPSRVVYEDPDFRLARLRVSDPSWGTYIISRPGVQHTLAERLFIQHMLRGASDV